MPLDHEIKIYRFLQTYGEDLIEGLDDEQAFTSHTEGGNHPAWIIGHLAVVGSHGVKMLGGNPAIDTDAWQPMFGGGSQPAARAEGYPAWDELVSVWKETHDLAASAAGAVTAEVLEQPNPIARRRKALPTLGSFVGFMFTGHEGVHLGQLSAWRRANGKPPLF
ncbi:MAG: DinB family protein [Planctomycetota bacterium]